MVICLIALPILAILGIFSATHRKLAAEAFDCVFRTVTLRKCQSQLDTKLKSTITAAFMKRSPKSAGWVFKHFEIIAWVFLILMLLSTYFSIQGVYNYIAYGNCNGPNSTEFCIFDPLGTGVSENCPEPACNQEICDCEECAGEACAENCSVNEGG